MIDSTSKLNEDVMRLIVECVAREEPLPRTKRDLKAAAQPLAWIRLSHVCQRWRKIVLGMGELWADNVIAIPGIYDTFLSRAADWPLSISIAPDTSIPKLIKLEIVDFMSKHLERVGRLDLHEHTVHIWPPNFLQDRALPRLHTLRLVDPPGEYRENVHINAPALRSAHIPRTPVTLYAPKLTHLTLGYLPNPPRLLFDTLSSSPSLEALSILFEGIGPNPWAECTSEPLYLENIKFIDLKGDSTTDLPAFFRLVRWPVTARTEIWWKESTRTAETFDETIDALAPYMYIPSRDTLRLCEDNTTSGAFACTLVLSASNTSTVGISKPGDFSFRSYGWLFSLDDEFEDAIGDPSNYTAVGMKWLSCLPRALYQIPEDQIRHIDFSSFPYFQGSGPAADALRRFDLTKTIRVDARSVVAGDILGRLLVPMPSFPALDEITLFVNHGLHHIAVAPWWRKVRSALRTRSDGGRQVRRLTICGARREDDNPEIAQAQPWAEVLVDAREPGK